MIISIGIFAAFYFVLFTGRDVPESIELDVLLRWLYVLLFLTIAAAFAGIVWSYLKNNR
jgi:hypothetical protein